MKIPEVLEKWFTRVNEEDSYLEKARGFTEAINPDGILSFIFNNNLERFARLKALGEEIGIPVEEKILMSEEEDRAMSEWLRNQMFLATLRFRKELEEEKKETRERVRRNIEGYAPESAKVIFEEDLKARLSPRD